MEGDSPGRPAVLLVEDNETLAGDYERWLSSRCDTSVAADGQAALDIVDDGFDVVFLDRRLPGLGGDAVLERIRDRDLDVRVVMATGISPDFDILDMGFDDYLVKPVDSTDLVETVDRMVARADFDGATREYYALCARKAALEDVKSDEELAASTEYARVEERIQALRDELDAALDSFGPGDFRAAFHSIPAGSDD